LRNRRFFSIAALNEAIPSLLVGLAVGAGDPNFKVPEDILHKFVVTPPANLQGLWPI
jgi:hypothetical protein